MLTERRRLLQSARRRSDREILSRFAEHWTSRAVARYQVEHDEVHHRLVEEFEIAALVEERP